MSSRIRVVTGPTVEPVTVDEVKTLTHVSHSVEDDLILRWIKTARQLAEGYQWRAYITQTLELSFDGFPSMPIEIPRSPLQSVTSIKYTDYLGTETTLYEAGNTDMFLVDTEGEPGRIDLAYNQVWPSVTLRTLSPVQIVFVAGYGDSADDVPDQVKDAILMYCGWRYENRAVETGWGMRGRVVPAAFFEILRDNRARSQL